MHVAAKSTETYSNDLIGVPDTRAHTRLPLEHDSTYHPQIRSTVNPLFMSRTIESQAPEFDGFARH